MELQAISPSKFLIFSFGIIFIPLLKVWNCVLRVCLSFVCVCMFVDVCLSDGDGVYLFVSGGPGRYRSIGCRKIRNSGGETFYILVVFLISSISVWVKKTVASMCEFWDKCEFVNEKFANFTPRYWRAVRAENRFRKIREVKCTGKKIISILVKVIDSVWIFNSLINWRWKIFFIVGEFYEIYTRRGRAD